MFKLRSFIIVGMLLACIWLVQSESQEKDQLIRIPLRKCDCLTTQELDPVCGSDGRTYGNPGRLGCYNECNDKDIKQVHKGACDDS